MVDLGRRYEEYYLFYPRVNASLSHVRYPILLCSVAVSLCVKYTYGFSVTFDALNPHKYLMSELNGKSFQLSSLVSWHKLCICCHDLLKWTS